MSAYRCQNVTQLFCLRGLVEPGSLVIVCAVDVNLSNKRFHEPLLTKELAPETTVTIQIIAVALSIFQRCQ